MNTQQYIKTAQQKMIELYPIKI